MLFRASSFRTQCVNKLSICNEGRNWEKIEESYSFISFLPYICGCVGTTQNPGLQQSDILCDISASVYTWVKLPKHFENYPADRPESFLLPLHSNSLLSIHFHAVIPHQGLKILLADKARACACVCLYMYYICIHIHRGMCYLTLESWTPSWKTEPFLIYVSCKQG